MKREVGVFSTLMERLPPPFAVCSFFVPVWEAAAPSPFHRAASILSSLASNPPTSPFISRRTHGSFHRLHHAVRHRFAPAHATFQLRANLPLSTVDPRTLSTVEGGRTLPIPLLLPQPFFSLYLPHACFFVPSIHASVLPGPSSSVSLRLSLLVLFASIPRRFLGKSLGENRPPSSPPLWRGSLPAPLTLLSLSTPIQTVPELVLHINGFLVQFSLC